MFITVRLLIPMLIFFNFVLVFHIQSHPSGQNRQKKQSEGVRFLPYCHSYRLLFWRLNDHIANLGFYSIIQTGTTFLDQRHEFTSHHQTE